MFNLDLLFGGCPKNKCFPDTKTGNQKSVSMGLSAGAFGRVFLTLLASYVDDLDTILLSIKIVRLK